MRQKMMVLLQNLYMSPRIGEIYYAGNARVQSKRLRELPAWDWTPESSRHLPGVSTYTFAIAFACEPLFTSAGIELCKPIIQSPGDVKNLIEPDIYSGRFGAILKDLQATLNKPGGCDRVRLPVIHSPLDIAQLMWNAGFYRALVESPAAVHELLEKLTSFIIRFIGEFARIAGPRLNAAGFPMLWSDEIGVSLTDATIALVSPEIHQTFTVPYLNRISKACGPLFYHAAGLREPSFDNLRKLKRIKALLWNPGNSADLQAILKAFGGNFLLIPQLYRGIHRAPEFLQLDRNFCDEAAVLSFILDRLDRHTGTFWRLIDLSQDGPLIERIYDVFHEHAATPQDHGVFL